MLVLFCVFLSLSLFLYLNENPLCPITLFILGHFLLLTPLLLMYDFVMIKPVGTFQRTSHDEAFIRNAKSFYRTFPIDLSTIIYNQGWESLCGILATCPSVIIHEFYSNMHEFDTLAPHFVTRVRGTCIVITLNLISKVLHVLRIAHLDYLGCDRLRTVSKDELLSLFCETPSSWGDRQNTPCSGFVKGPRFLNMVMIFILHPLSHYNFITEPRARFLLSLLKDISIDFPFHFILSLIDVYRDMATHDKLIFPSAITRILHHFSISYLEFTHFSVMYSINVATIRWSEA